MQENRFWAKLAEVPLWIEPSWSYTSSLFGQYKISPSDEDKLQYANLMETAGLDPNQPIRVSDAEVEREQDFCEEAPNGFPDDYLESLAVYRKLCGLLIEQNILLFHCSSLELDGEAYLFTAPSGTGKSTHARLWRQVFGDRVKMINDDKPLMRYWPDGSWEVFGTPYGGKDDLQANISQKVKEIVLLEQAPENYIERVTPHDAYPRLLAQSYRERDDPAKLLHTMDLVGALSQLPVFRMGCTISEEAVWMAYHALKGTEQ